MKRQTTTLLIAWMLIGWLGALPTARAETPKARKLIERVVQRAGGLETLYEKRDVEYVYLYRDLKSGKLDVSIERYVFDGELSWAQFPVHEKFVLPDQQGVVVQGYDGNKTWSQIDGQPVTDPEALKTADFLRKTNYYWFTMMFKLLDPGVNHEYLGQRTVGEQAYEAVKVTFGQGVGDVSDTYVLYINPRTWLVDQFLFTVLDFGMTDPLLMKVKYEQIEGLTLPTLREYGPADWSGQEKGPAVAQEISLNVEFDNGFTARLFKKPR